MIKLDFPVPDFKTRKVGGKVQIFDVIRARWVVLQPEEWVRQNLINWLIKSQHIPAAYISVEQSLKTNTLSKRCDLVIYSRDHLPWMMIEVKAQGIELNEVVLGQILNYNRGLQVKYILITNGDHSFLADLNKPDSAWMEYFPAFE